MLAHAPAAPVVPPRVSRSLAAWSQILRWDLQAATTATHLPAVPAMLVLVAFDLHQAGAALLAQCLHAFGHDVQQPCGHTGAVGPSRA